MEREGVGETKWGRQVGPAVVIPVEWVDEPAMQACAKQHWQGTERVAFQQVPVTLEDVAAYLSQEEWECLDPARRGCGWDMLPESGGNVLISGMSVTWARLREGGSFL